MKISESRSATSTVMLKNYRVFKTQITIKTESNYNRAISFDNVEKTAVASPGAPPASNDEIIVIVITFNCEMSNFVAACEKISNLIFFTCDSQQARSCCKWRKRRRKKRKLRRSKVHSTCQDQWARNDNLWEQQNLCETQFSIHLAFSTAISSAEWRSTSSLQLMFPSVPSRRYFYISFQFYFSKNNKTTTICSTINPIKLNWI